MADNYYSKHSSKSDVADYWANDRKKRYRTDLAVKTAPTIGDWLAKDYKATKLAKSKAQTGTQSKGLLSKVLTYGNDSAGFLGGAEQAVAKGITSPVTGLGSLATKAGFAKTGGLLTGAGTAVQGALTSMGPVGWALLAGTLFMANKGKGGVTTRSRRY